MKNIIILCLWALLFLACIPDREIPNVWKNLPETQQLLIVNPSDGDTIMIDTSYCNINWYYRGGVTESSIFRFYLINEDTLVSIIDSSYSSYKNNLKWTPSRHYNGNSDRYRIVMKDLADTLISDTSDYFALHSPYHGGYDISVTYIDSYTDSLDIDWVTQGYPGKRVKVQLYKDSTYLFTLRDSLWDSGGYKWKYPANLFIDGSDYRIKVQAYFDNAIASFSAPFSLVGGVVQDSFEIDNDIANAKTITNGETQNRSSYLWDVDWISFNCQVGKSYQLKIGSNDEMRIKIFGVDTSVVLAADTISDYPVIDFTPSVSGTYYAQIKHNFKTSYYDDEYSVTLKEYNSLFAGTITTPMLGDTLLAGRLDTVTLVEILDMSDYKSIALYRDTSLVYIIDSSAYSYYNRYSWLIPSWTESGMYSIKINDSRADSLFCFSDPFYIKGVTNDANEINNSILEATEIATNTTNANILTVGDEDWFRLPVNEGLTYGISVNPANAVTLSLWNSSQMLHSMHTIKQESVISFSATKEEQLYIKVDAGTDNKYAQFGDAYSLKVESIDSDSLITFMVPNANSVFYAQNSYDILWDAPFMDSQKKLDLYKGDTHITTIKSNLGKSDNRYNWFIMNGLVTGSDYRIKITSKTDTASYAFSAPFTVNGLLPDAFEVDQPAELANTNTQFERTDQHTIIIGDSDWVKIPVEPDYYYTATIKSDFSCQAGFYRTNTLNAIEIFYCDDTTVSNSYSPVIDDTLLICVSGIDSIDGGSYEMTLYKTAKDSLISFITPTKQSIFAAGQSYLIEWKAPAIDDRINISLYKGNTTLYKYTNQINDGSIAWGFNSSYATGNDYQFKIENANDSTVYKYSDSFTISGTMDDSYEPDNDKVNAKVIELNASTGQERTLTYNDVDWVSFPMIKDSLYDIGVSLVSNSGTEIGLTVVDTNNIDLIPHAVGESYLWLCETSGTYYLKVKQLVNTGSFYGSYKLSVGEYSRESYKPVISLPGEILNADGSASEISWSNWKLLGSTVDLFLFKDEQIVATIEANITNNGTFSWIIPSTIAKGSGYSIVIISKWKSQIQGQSALFTIQ